MKRLLCIFMTGIILLVVTVGCAKGSDSKATENVVISYGFWGSEEELKVQTDNAKGISEVFPNIEIEIQHYPSSNDFWDSLPTQIAAGTAPDLLKITNEGAFEYIDDGLLAGMSSYIEEAGLDMSSYTESAKKIWVHENETYGIPVNVAPSMFFINTDMWESAGLGEYPKTWDDVISAAKALTNDETYGLIINLHEYHITNFILTYGGGWGNGKTINSKENVQALEIIFSMYDEGIAISPSILGFGWDGEVFSNGKGAMTTGGYWYKGFLKNAAPDLNYAVIPVPKGTMKGSTLHSDAIVILNDSSHKLAATKAAYFLTNDEALNNLMESVGINPAKTELAEKYYEINPEFKAVEAIVPFAQDFGYPADAKRFADTLIGEIESKILGASGATAQEILDKVQILFD